MPYDDGDKEVIDEYYNQYHGKRQPLFTLAMPIIEPERKYTPKPQRLNGEHGNAVEDKV